MELPFAINLKVKISLAMIMALMGLAFSLSPLGSMADFVQYDVLQVLKTTSRQMENIVIVAIDEPSFEVLGKQWPWPRSIHAGLMNALFEAGAKTIAMDILFPEPSSPQEDQLFARALNENVVLAASLETIHAPGHVSSINVLPMSLFLERHCKIGLDILPLDSDGLLRKGIVTLNNQSGFAFSAAKTYCPVDCRDSLQQIRSNPNDMLINFAGPPGKVTTVSYYQALEPFKYLPENFFKNKLVFVGFTIRNAAHLQTPIADHYPTPYVRLGSGHMAGVELQANIAANLLHHDFIKTIPLSALMVVAVILWLIAGRLSYRFSPLTSGLIGVCMIAAGSGAIFYSFSCFRVFVPFSILLFPSVFIYLSGLLLHYYQQLKEKTYIKQVFSRYVSSSVVKLLLKHPEKLKLGGEFAQGTVMFLDIKNFTQLTRQTPAKDLISILSRYLGKFSDIVLENNGMVDKIAGDALMAVWGVPLAQPDHAVLACRAVLKIEQAYEELKKEDNDLHKRLLSIRIGINSGTLLAGNIGGKYFSDYTVHGVDVNFANQLESLNKKYNTRILMGQNTKRLLPDEFHTRKIDMLNIEGDSAPVAIYELKTNTGNNRTT